MGEMLDRYFEWNEALVEEYFPEGNEGRVAILPVDDDELVALAEEWEICDPEDAVDDFVGAVNFVLRSNQGQFSVLSRWAKRRREEGDDIPRYVAGLAFCVLAASRMEGDEAVHPNNYYVRLNKLMGGTGDEKQPENFDLVQLAWEDLSTWLDVDCEKKRGASTIRTGAHRHIGYPIGQCPLRAIDKRRLPDFFQPRDLRPEDAETIGDEHLFSLLQAWASLQSRPLSKPATRAIAEAKGRDRDEIVETVRRELKGWDGSLRDSKGRKRFPLRLHLMPQAKRLVLIAELPDTEPDGYWQRSDGGGEIFVESDPTAPGWSEPLAMKVDANVLSAGVKLVRGGVALSYDPTAAIPFRVDEDSMLFDSFLSQRQTAMWKPHWAVVRRDLLQMLEQYIRSQTKSELPVYENVDSFPRNWALAGPFEFVNQPALAPPDISHFAPKLTQSVSFRGGLRISSVDSIYLVGGEPDLLVSTDEAQSTSAVEIDGHSEALGSGSRLIPLSRMNMEAGPHTVSTGVRRTFTTKETLGEISPLPAGSFGLSFRHHTQYHPDAPIAQPVDSEPSAEQLVVAGAAIRGEPEHLPSRGIPPEFFRSTFKRCALIGPGVGEYAEAESNKAPKWIEEIGLGNRFQFAEIRPDFEPAWRLIESEGGEHTVVYIGSGTDSATPKIERAREWFDALYKWSEAVATDPEKQEAWGQFVELALSHGSDTKQ